MKFRMQNLLLLSVLLLNTPRINSLSIPIISDIQDILSLASDINDIASETLTLKTLFSPQPNPLNTAIETINNIGGKIESLKDTIEGQFDVAVRQILSRIPQEDKLNRRMEKFHKQIVTVDRIFEDLMFYSNDSDYFQPIVMEGFVDAVTSMGFGSIPHVLNVLSDIVISRMPIYFHQGLLSLLLQREIDTITDNERCDNGESFQRRVFELYSMIVLTELRAHAATTFAYRFIAEFHNVSVEIEVEKSEARLVLRAEEYMLEFADILNEFPRDIYRCDPPKHISGETYTELEGPFTSIVMQTEQIGYNKRRCDRGCSQVHTTKLGGCIKKSDSKYIYGYCGIHKCQGLVHSCEQIPVKRIKICENPKNSARFFENLQDEENYYGNKGACSSSAYYMRQSSYYEQVMDLCRMCICKCDQSVYELSGARIISLLPQMTDIDNNKVVSNIRFARKGPMISIEIEQSPLMPFGEIHANEKEWVSLGKFQGSKNSEGWTLFILRDDDWVELIEREDYVYIDQSQRILHLDEVVAPLGYLITGVRFNLKRSKSNTYTPLRLEIHVTPWDIDTGKLVPTEEKPSYWLDADTQPYKAYAYKAERGTVGSEENYVYDEDDEVIHDLHLEPNKQIRFQQSNLRSDYGQRTVPFFDIRPALQSRALDGLGLIWRGNEKYAGFIALKIFGINDAQFLRPFFTASQSDHYRSLYPAKVTHQPLIDDTKAMERK